VSARRVVYTRHADRDLLRLPEKDRAAIADAVETWGRGEAHVDVEKLTDVRPPEWRLRVGRWRALVDRPEPEVIRVLRVLDRKEAYRR